MLLAGYLCHCFVFSSRTSVLDLFIYFGSTLRFIYLCESVLCLGFVFGYDDLSEYTQHARSHADDDHFQYVDG